MNTSTHRGYTQKHSIEGLVDHEIIENVKNFHETQIQTLKKMGPKNWLIIVIVHNSISVCFNFSCTCLSKIGYNGNILVAMLYVASKEFYSLFYLYMNIAAWF